MKPEKFVSNIRQSILADNLIIYRELFNETEIDQATDKYWKEALQLYKKLDKDDQEILFKIMRQVTADTISNLFGVLDGVSWLEDQEDDFKLSIDNDKQEKLNGDLQDIFLEAEEEQ